MKQLIILLFLVSILTISFTPITESQIVWKKNITFTNNTNQFHVDANGNTVITGTTETRRYDSNGNELWQINAGGVNAVTSSGNIYIKTLTELKKYTPDGELLWNVNDNSINAQNNPSHIFIDSDESSYLFDHNTFTLTKYNSAGSLVWAKVFTIQGRQTLIDPLCDVGFDGSGNIFIALFNSWPTTWSTVIPDSLTLYKMNSNGNLQWSRSWLIYSSKLNEQVHKDGRSDFRYRINSWNVSNIVVDKLGNVYLAGTSDALTETQQQTTRVEKTLFDNLSIWLIRKVTTDGKISSKGFKGNGGILTNYITKYGTTTQQNKTKQHSSSLSRMYLSPNGILYAGGLFDERKSKNNVITGDIVYGTLALNPKLNKVGKFIPFGGIIGFDVQGNAFTQSFLNTYNTSDLFLWKINERGIVQRSSIGIPNNEIDARMVSYNSFFDAQGNLYTAKEDMTGVTLIKFAIPSMVSVSPSTELEHVSDDLVSSYNLSNNYPNPFNPTTTISYSIPVDGMVTLTIFNTLGQEVETLVNEFQDAGFNSVTWDASNQPSGMYYYKLQAGTFTDTKKLLLMK